MSNSSDVSIKDAKSIGFNQDCLARLKASIEQDTSEGTYDGAVFLVARGGTVDA